MNYTGRPAWRNQWANMTMTALIAAAFLLVLPTVLKMEGGRLIGLFIVAVLILLVLTILYRHHSLRITVTQESIESRHGIIARHGSPYG